MKKHIWIIGNDDPACGVSVDVENYQKYFNSPRGGCWNNDEITISKDITLTDCRRIIRYFKAQNYDYFVLAFSGHGGIIRGTMDTQMCLTSDERNTISESEFAGISSRQLNILDCCRDYYSRTEMVKASNATVLTNSSSSIDRSRIRRLYENKIARSSRCLYSLYACSPGECAKGSSGKGGYFTSALIQISQNWSLSGNDATLNDIYIPVRDTVRRLGGHTPDFDLPRCMPWQRLVWINYPFV